MLPHIKSIYKKNEFISAAVVIVLLITLTSFSPYFLDINNTDSLQTSIAPSGIIAIGMIILMITGLFDLSVGSIMIISGEVAGICMTMMNMPVYLAIIFGIFAGALGGMVNGILVAYIRINPLIATLGTMFIFRGISEIILVGEGMYSKLTGFPANFLELGSGKFCGIYFMLWVMLIIGVIVQICLINLPIGRKLYFIGGNEEAARLMGFKTKRIKAAAYVFSGMLTGLAGILATARYEMVNRYLGDGMHMSVIISCIIGGGSLAGGKGSIVGALFGVSFTTLLGNSFNLFEVESRWQNVVIGAILVLVVLIDGLIQLRRKRSTGRI